jgi:hypothetical protein
VFWSEKRCPVAPVSVTLKIGLHSRKRKEAGTVVLSSLCGVRLSFNEAVVARSLAQPEFFGDSSRARLCVRGRRESGSSRHDDVAQCEWSGSYTASALLHFVPYYQQSLDVSP